MTVKPPIPVTLIAGFLGSGKTTLVNHILNGNHGYKIALIENEFGEIGIDNQIVENIDDLLVEMNNGCLCCTVRGDMVNILNQMLDSEKDFDYVVIESTGVANPAKVAEAFVGDSPLVKKYKLDSVLTVVDTFNFSKNLNLKEEFTDQICFANQILLNKIDLCDESLINQVKETIKRLNSEAEIIHTDHCQVSLNNILQKNFFDLKSIENSLEEKHTHSHSHVGSVALEAEGVLNPGHFQSFLNFLYASSKDRLYRAKGIISFPNSEEKVIFQAVYDNFEFNNGKPWGDNKRINRLVFIGKGLNREILEKGLKNCLMSEEELQLLKD